MMAKDLYISPYSRLLQLTTPLGADALQGLRAPGVERIGRTPRYTLDVLVQDTEYDPEKLIGQPVSLALLCDDGTQAPRHGLVESVRYLGSDGGLHDWQLVFAPWFSLLEYRSDCPIWQDKNLPTILETVFAQCLDLRRDAHHSLAPLFKSVQTPPIDSLAGSKLSEAFYRLNTAKCWYRGPRPKLLATNTRMVTLSGRRLGTTHSEVL